MKACNWTGGLAGIVFSCVAAAAGEPRALVVPAERATLHVAVDVPAGPPVSGPGRLVEIGGSAAAVPAQLVRAVRPDGTPREGGLRLVAAIGPSARAEGVRRFRWEAVSAVPGPVGEFTFRDVNRNSLGLYDGGRPVLVYNHGMITIDRVPKNDPRRTRSSYIHPLWGLQGEVLTDDSPADHYHHRGVFWAWPHILIDRREYDLWVYGNIQQRFVRWLDRQTGPAAAVLGVENGWFVGQKQVMIERVWLRTYKPVDGQRPLDIELVFVPVEKPVTLRGAEGKSYGGLNVRFAPRRQTVITVPGGVAKDDLPDTPLAWADLTGSLTASPGKGPSGLAIFADTATPDFPPRWLTRHYGILCVGSPGVKEKTIESGRPFRLGYRLWIHGSAAGPDTIAAAYRAYTQGLRAEWK
jgi:hypothetical protein